MQALFDAIDDVPTVLKAELPSMPVAFRECANVEAAKYVTTLALGEYTEQFLNSDSDEKNKTAAEVKANFNMVRAICREVIQTGGKAREVEYKYGKESPKSGRIFAHGKGGIQRVSRALRSMMSMPDMVDYDMANCHPTILLWVCKSLDLPTHHLGEYVQDRPRILEETGKSKTDMNTILNKDYNKAKGEHQWIRSFYKELKANKAAIHSIVHGGYPTNNTTSPYQLHGEQAAL